MLLLSPHRAAAMCSHEVSKAEAEAVMARHARTSEAGLTLPEFSLAVQRVAEARSNPEAELARLFSLLDADGKGYVEASDLQQVCAGGGAAAQCCPPPQI